MATSIISQPAANSMQHAYSALALRYIVGLDSSPQGYCDVYFNGTYYKTVIATSKAAIISSANVFVFNIAGVCQEYIQSIIPDIEASAAANIVYDEATSILYGQVKVFCKFRQSTADPYGVITPQAPEPVQATVDNAASAGGGTSSNTIYVVKAALQHEDQRDFETYLIKNRITSATVVSSIDLATKVYSLTTKQKEPVYLADHGLLPIIIGKNGFCGGASTANVYTFFWGYDANDSLVDGITIYGGVATTLKHNTIYNIPVGVPNVLDGQDSTQRTIINNILKYCTYYRIILWQATAFGTVVTPILISPKYYVRYKSEEHTRIWYQNTLGELDTINFRVKEETIKVSSSAREKPFALPVTGFTKATQRLSRINVTSNEVVTLSDVFLEEELYLIKQLCNSSLVYIEASPAVESSDHEYGLIPIVLVDGEYVMRKYEDRYEYEVVIKYTMSNDNIIIRN